MNANERCIELHVEVRSPAIYKIADIKKVEPYGDRWRPLAKVTFNDGTVLRCREYYHYVQKQLL